MKRLLIALSSICISVASNVAMASLDLAKSKNCMACHAVDNKLVGPAYKEVAKKYAGQKDTQSKLANKIIKGGSGTWGVVPMPPNPTVTQPEAQTLAKWILDMK